MEGGDAPAIPFTSDDRIKQLAEIDKNVTKLLRAAGEAVEALASRTIESNNSDPSYSSSRTAFTSATSRYFSLLSSVDVSIRRQIWALEEANIINSSVAEKDSQAIKDNFATEAAGIGSLDVGWLNSRNDKVGKEMEAELWEKASSLLATMNQHEDVRDPK